MTKRGGGGRRLIVGRHALVFAIAAAVLLAGGAAAAVAKAGGVSAVFDHVHSMISGADPNLHWRGPGVIAASASGSEEDGATTSPPDPSAACTSATDATDRNVPSGAKGLDNAIAHVGANCASEPQAPGLLNALQHLLANVAKHQAKGHGSGSSGPPLAHGNGSDHGTGDSDHSGGDSDHDEHDGLSGGPHGNGPPGQGPSNGNASWHANTG